jgi:hypothetical protein
MIDTQKGYPQTAVQLGRIAHPNQGAVAQCTTCSRGLCPDCAPRFEPPSCDACVVNNNTRAERELWTGLVITAAIAFASPFFLRSAGIPLGQSLFTGVQFAFAWWGWKFLSAHLPSLSRAALATWFVYFFFKLVASMFIGLVVGPYQLYRLVTLLRVLRHARAVVSDNPAESEGSEQGLSA